MGELFFNLFGLGAEAGSYNQLLFSSDSDVNCTFANLLYFNQEVGTYASTEASLFLGIAMLVLSIGLTLVYYYAIDSVKFNRWYHWLIWMGLVFGVLFGTAFWISQSQAYEALTAFVQENELSDVSISLYDYTATLSFTVALWGVGLSVVSSFLLRFRSINCRKTPF